MGFEVVLIQQDLLHCRFAVSPAWETWQAVRTLTDPRRQPFHLPWLRTARPRADRLDLRPLRALQVPAGYVPDFVSPAPRLPVPDIEDELDQVRRTSSRVVVTELTRCLEGQRDRGAREQIKALLRDPAAAREKIAALLRTCWTELVRPDWPRVLAVLEDDIAFHARRIAESGLGPVLNTIHSTFSFSDGVLRIEGRYNARYDLAGSGIILRPSAFAWPDAVLTLGTAGAEPTLIYPARGVGDLWLPQSPNATDALARLIGRTRAALLAGLDQPATTTALARRHALSPSGASAHLTVLRDAGLLRSRRQGREVLYSRTPLGQAVLKSTPDDT
ncbi:DUF5937 family protein [Spirillospora sp. NPDC049652]